MAGQHNVTDSELEGLSAEERAALADPEDTTAPTVIDDDTPESDKNAAAIIASDDDDEDDDPAAEAPAAEAPAAEAEAEAEAEAAAPAAEIPAAEVDDDIEPFVPRYQAEPVPDYAAKMNALDKAFDDGDLPLKEYNTQRDALIRQQTKAEIAAEQESQLAEQRWSWEIKRFVKDVARDEGIDYNKPMLNAALDTAVKSLARDANGNLINGDKDGEWFLQEAHRLVKAELGLAAPKVTPPVTPNAPTKPTGPRTTIKTLSQIPSADVPDTGAVDPFANIDNLFANGKTEQAEMELAKMSKTDQDRFLRVGAGS
jgi:hypothetical protein